MYCHRLFCCLVWSHYHQTSNPTAKIGTNTFLKKSVTQRVLLLVHFFNFDRNTDNKIPNSSSGRIFKTDSSQKSNFQGKIDTWNLKILFFGDRGWKSKVRLLFQLLVHRKKFWMATSKNLRGVGFLTMPIFFYRSVLESFLTVAWFEISIWNL